MLSTAIRNIVFERANFLCEYCLSPMDFTHKSFEIEHIIPISKNGTDDLDNLACACSGCNASKYNKIFIKDPFDGSVVTIFHPRKMDWYDHFAWSNDFLEIIGKTDIGRATVNSLKLNRKGLKNIRRVLLLDGSHPPK